MENSKIGEIEGHRECTLRLIRCLAFFLSNQIVDFRIFFSLIRGFFAHSFLRAPTSHCEISVEDPCFITFIALILTSIYSYSKNLKHSIIDYNSLLPVGIAQKRNAMFSFEQGSLNNEIAEEIRHEYQSQECSGYTVEGNVNISFQIVPIFRNTFFEVDIKVYGQNFSNIGLPVYSIRISV